MRTSSSVLHLFLARQEQVTIFSLSPMTELTSDRHPRLPPPPLSTQLRHGGDIKGLVTDRSLDYLELMGVKVIYISGTPFLNMPWQADGYSALDFTLLDPHWGTVQDWADSIQKIHDRGM